VGCQGHIRAQAKAFGKTLIPVFTTVFGGLVEGLAINSPFSSALLEATVSNRED